MKNNLRTWRQCQAYNLCIALVTAIVGGLGAGASTPIIVGPFIFALGIKANVDTVIKNVAIGMGNCQTR